MSPVEVVLLAGAGVVAGIINTLAGGGSLITVPLLVMLGLPGTVANGTNRVGVLVQSVVGTWRFRAEGVSGLAGAVPILLPLSAGSLLGALVISRLTDETFERIFAVVMLALLVPALRPPPATREVRAAPWPPLVSFLVFFAIGIYGGAVQAGVGIMLVLALSRSGYDLVRSNSIKLAVVAVFTLVAVAVFVARGQVVWLPALVLALSTSVGASVGAAVAVRGGEAAIRPVMALAVVALAGRLLRLY